MMNLKAPHRMKKSKYFAIILCIMLCYSITYLIAQAQVSTEVSMSSYGSVVASASSPSPTPTPKPTTTPSPTPTPKPTTNVAPVPNGWTTADTGMEWGIGGVTNVVLDTNVLYNGNPTIRIDPVGNTGNAARECDGPYISIAPGDQIVFSCWIKTTASSLGDTNPNSGGRIGIDFYSAAGRITGTDAPDGSVWTPTSGWPNGQTYVNWNTNTWTQVTISFTVPSTYPADGTTGGYSAGQLVIPTAIIPWMQVWSSTYGASDQGQAWFANPQLTITTQTATLTPTTDSTQALTTSPTASATPIPTTATSSTITPTPTSTPTPTPTANSTQALTTSPTASATPTPTTASSQDTSATHPTTKLTQTSTPKLIMRSPLIRKFHQFLHF